MLMLRGTRWTHRQSGTAGAKRALPDASYTTAVTSTPSVPVSSLLNSEPLEGVDHAEKDIMDLLNQLEEQGVLQNRNRMDLDELLNPVSEQGLVDETVSDEEIFRSVVDMRKAEQMIEVNGGYDIDDDAVDQKPMRKEALTAAFALRSYVTDINKPFACKLEGILASFG